MTALSRVEALSQHDRMGMDVITPVLRSEGYSDSEIRDAYDAMLDSPNWEVRVDRMIIYFVPV